MARLNLVASVLFVADGDAAAPRRVFGIHTRTLIVNNQKEPPALRKHDTQVFAHR
jgi:hypothetical protein